MEEEKEEREKGEEEKEEEEEGEEKEKEKEEVLKRLVCLKGCASPSHFPSFSCYYIQ